MATVYNIFIPAYNLVKGKDFLSGYSLHQHEAEKNAKKLLIELFKVSAGVAGFVAISVLMRRMPSSLSAHTVGLLAVGGTCAFTSRVSVILFDASKITAGLFVLQKGCVDLCVIPAIQAAKAVIHSLLHIHEGPFSIPSIPRIGSIVLSTVKMVGMGYLRFIAGMLSSGIAFSLMTSDSWKLSALKNSASKRLDRSGFGRTSSQGGPDSVAVSELSKTVVDRVILRTVKVAARFLVRMCGYSAY